MTLRRCPPFVLTALALSVAVTTVACGSDPSSSSSSGDDDDAEQAALGSGASDSASAAAATTTRTALTANNTSASSLFRDEYTPAARFFGQDIGVVTNGDNPTASTTATTLADGAISKVSLHTLLPGAASTKIFFETQSWFCTNATSSTTALSSGLESDQCGAHIDIGYANNSTAQASKQVADMQSRGADGILVDWQGPSSTLVQNRHTTDVTEINDGALSGFKSAAEATKGFTFAVVEDEAAKASAKTTGSWTKGIIADLTYLSEKMYSSPAYYRSNGRPVVFFFGVDHYASAAGSSIDWATVKASVPGNPLLVFEDTGHTLADGGYAWPSPTDIGSYPGSDPFDVKSYLPHFYKAAAKLNLAYGMAYKGFDDHAVNGWVSDPDPSKASTPFVNGRRYSGQQCGKTWLDSFKMASANAATIDAVQLPTWDDYEEATELETGIDNHLAVTAKVSGATLSWTLAAESDAPADCTEAIREGLDLADTVHHFAVYASPANDGEKLTLVADDLSPATRSLDLTGKLAAGSWVLSVRAVAQPSITNKLSAAVAFTSGGGGGGGAPDAGASCSGVPTILEPFASEDVGPSIELRVQAPSCIETMVAYIDGQAVATITGNTADRWIPVSLGAHVVNVNGWAGADVAHTSAHVAFTRTY